MIENDGVCTSKLSRFERMVGIIEEFRDRTGKDPSIRVSWQTLCYSRVPRTTRSVSRSRVKRITPDPFLGGCDSLDFCVAIFFIPKCQERRETYNLLEKSSRRSLILFFYRLKKRKRLVVSYKTIKFRFRISKWIANIGGSADYKYFNVQ